MVLHCVLTVIVKLDKVRQIHTKTPIHIFEGFTLFSVRKFKEPLILLLNQEHVAQINTAVCLSNTTAATLVIVKEISIRQSPPTILFELQITDSYKET